MSDERGGIAGYCGPVMLCGGMDGLLAAVWGLVCWLTVWVLSWGGRRVIALVAARIAEG